MLTQFENGAGQLPAQLYNRSRDLIEAHLCHLPSPKLPTNSQQVEAWLFGQPSLRIPVTPLYYQQAAVKDLSMAQQTLIPADQSAAVVAFTALLQHEPPFDMFSTELLTSRVIWKYLYYIWEQLDAATSPLQYRISLNEAEKTSSHSSRTQKQKRRPDTMVIVSKCTLLLGEDKHSDLEAAFKDLREKRADLCSLHYQNVTFLMGYAAAGASFQWCFLPGVAQQVSLSAGISLDIAAACFPSNCSISCYVSAGIASNRPCS